MTPSSLIPRRVRRAAARAHTGAWGTRCDDRLVVAAVCVRVRYRCSPRSMLPPRIALACAAMGGLR